MDLFGRVNHEKAVKMLMSQINGDDPQKIIEKAELIIRKSLAKRK